MQNINHFGYVLKKIHKAHSTSIVNDYVVLFRGSWSQCVSIPSWTLFTYFVMKKQCSLLRGINFNYDFEHKQSDIET